MSILSRRSQSMQGIFGIILILKTVSDKKVIYNIHPHPIRTTSINKWERNVLIPIVIVRHFSASMPYKKMLEHDLTA